MSGDGVKTPLIGNGLPGDGEAGVWENLLDLSHSVYPESYHSNHLWLLRHIRMSSFVGTSHKRMS
ncbi:hypothetical protein PMJ6TS7_36440 [Paenibacillus melissococcoides]